MAKKMIFNVAEPEEVRAAIIEDGILTEYDIESAVREKNRGNIYRGYVVKVETSIQAAFVEYGGGRHGFLPFDEIHPDFYSRKVPNSKQRPRIQDVIVRGQTLLVQVVREEVDQKGATLTTYFSLPGRYLVLMPRSEGSGISRKIEDMGERKSLRKIMSDLEPPPGFGYIVRTAGLGKTRTELSRELNDLLRLWKNIQKRANVGPRVGLIFREGDIIFRMIRDYFDSEVKEILIDEESAYERASQFFSAIMPRTNNVVTFYQGKRPLFDQYQVEQQIAQVYERVIPLPSGGSIVLDTTEALVAIDVNSGKTQSDRGTEDTALKTNIEAAHEIGRQLRLRDLGGIVIIDFIDMRFPKNIREVERACREALKKDKARVKIGRISRLGVLELSRQRIRDTKEWGHFVPCPTCQGLGKISNVEARAMALLRRLQDAASKDVYERLEVTAPEDVAWYLLNQKRAELAKLEREYELTIYLQARAGIVNNFEEDLKLIYRTSPRRLPSPRLDPVQFSKTLEEKKPSSRQDERGGPVSITEPRSAHLPPTRQERPSHHEELPPREEVRSRGEPSKESIPPPKEALTSSEEGEQGEDPGKKKRRRRPRRRRRKKSPADEESATASPPPSSPTTSSSPDSSVQEAPPASRASSEAEKATPPAAVAQPSEPAAASSAPLATSPPAPEEQPLPSAPSLPKEEQALPHSKTNLPPEEEWGKEAEEEPLEAELPWFLSYLDNPEELEKDIAEESLSLQFSPPPEKNRTKPAAETKATAAAETVEPPAVEGKKTSAVESVERSFPPQKREERPRNYVATRTEQAQKEQPPGATQGKTSPAVENPPAENKETLSVPEEETLEEEPSSEEVQEAASPLEEEARPTPPPQNEPPAELPPPQEATVQEATVQDRALRASQKEDVVAEPSSQTSQQIPLEPGMQDKKKEGGPIWSKEELERMRMASHEEENRKRRERGELRGMTPVAVLPAQALDEESPPPSEEESVEEESVEEESVEEESVEEESVEEESVEEESVREGVEEENVREGVEEESAEGGEERQEERPSSLDNGDSSVSAEEVSREEEGSSSSIRQQEAARLSTSRSRPWTREELEWIRQHRHLPPKKAHQAFLAQGFERTVSAFRSKYYNVPSGGH